MEIRRRNPQSTEKKPSSAPSTGKNTVSAQTTSTSTLHTSTHVPVPTIGKTLRQTRGTLPSITIIAILSAILFALPVFLCNSPNIYQDHTSPNSCPPSTKLLPLPSCSPLCSTLYYGKSLITNTVDAAFDFAKTYSEKALVHLQLKEKFKNIARLPPTPVLPLFRIGQAAINFFTNVVELMIPPEKRIMMFTSYAMQLTALRAVAKLHIAEIITDYQLQKKRELLSLESESIQAQYKDNIEEYSTFDKDIAVPIAYIAKKSCTKADLVERLLRAVSTIGAFSEIPTVIDEKNQVGNGTGLANSSWLMNDFSSLLHHKHPRTMKSAILMFGGEQYIALSSLHQTIQTGVPAFKEVYGDFWEYQKLGADEWLQFKDNNDYNQQYTGPDYKCKQYIPNGAKLSEEYSNLHRDTTAIYGKTLPFQLPVEYSLGSTEPGDIEKQNVKHISQDENTTEIVRASAPRLNNARDPIMFAYDDFNKAMTSISSLDSQFLATEIPVDGFDTIVDIAGGYGHFMHDIMAANKHLTTGILFDTPFVLENNQAKALVAQKALKLQNRRLTHDKNQCRWSQCSIPESSYSISNDLKNIAVEDLEPDAREIVQKGIESNRQKRMDVGYPHTAYQCPVQEKWFNTATIKSHTSKKMHKVGDTHSHDEGGDDLSENNIKNIHDGNEKSQFLQQLNNIFHTFTSSTKDIVLGSEGARVKREEIDMQGLCPSTHAISGSFFEKESVPKAHYFSKPSLQHKLLSKVRRGEKISNDTTLTHTSAYVMMQILHDWNDEDSKNILKSLHHAMIQKPSRHEIGSLCCGCSTDQSTSTSACGSVPFSTCDESEGSNKKSIANSEYHGNDEAVVQQHQQCTEPSIEYKSRLFIVDRILLPDASFIYSQGGNLADILMMNNFDLAKERDVPTFQKILKDSGFRLLRILPSRSMYGIVEAEPIIQGVNDDDTLARIGQYDIKSNTQVDDRRVEL